LQFVSCPSQPLDHVKPKAGDEIKLNGRHWRSLHVLTLWRPCLISDVINYMTWLWYVIHQLTSAEGCARFRQKSSISTGLSHSRRPNAPLDEENYLFKVSGKQPESFEVILVHNAIKSFQQKVPPILLGVFEDIFD
jgi:hypothetical protein